MNHDLRTELLAMARADEALRAELAASGALFEGYHPRMRALHGRHGERLQQILDEHGWPRRDEVGDDGQRAAWTILQHAIEMPALMRRGLALVRAAAARGEAPPAQVAALEDRICFYEGRPQRYGTQHDWDEHGELRPWTIEDPDGVDARRRAVGLPPLAEETERLRAQAAREGERPAGDPAARRAAAEWARRVGWRA